MYIMLSTYLKERAKSKQKQRTVVSLNHFLKLHYLKTNKTIRLDRYIKRVGANV